MRNRFVKKIKENTNDAELPLTRKQLLREIIRDDFALVIDCSLLLALFSIPLLAVWLAQYLLLTGVDSLQNAFPVVFYGSLVCVPCFVVRYLARGAVFELFKKRAFNEGCFVAAHFALAIKQNCKKYLFVGFVVGISYFLATVGGFYIVMLNLDSIAKGFGIGFCLLQFMIVYCMAEYFLSSNCIYDLGIGGLMKNGFRLTFTTFAPCMLHFVVSVALPLALSAMFVWAAVAVAAVYLTVLEGILVATATVYSQSIFDKYINNIYYPEIVRKGLKKEAPNG